MARRTLATCRFGNTALCFEPRVGQVVLRQMLFEAGVVPYQRKVVPQLYGVSNRIDGAYTTDSDLFTHASRSTPPSTVICCPSPASTTVRGTPWPSSGLNPAACVQDITYTAVIRKYPGAPPPRS